MQALLTRGAITKEIVLSAKNTSQGLVGSERVLRGFFLADLWFGVESNHG